MCVLVCVYVRICLWLCVCLCVELCPGWRAALVSGDGVGIVLVKACGGGLGETAERKRKAKGREAGSD